jgi:flagellar basal body-associated protein FliL
MEENLNQVSAESTDSSGKAAKESGKTAKESGEAAKESGEAAEASPKKKRVRWLLWVGVIVAFITGAGIGSLYLLSPVRQVPQKIKISSPLARKSDLSSMEAFLIPFREKGNYTCLTLNLSFEWSDKNVEKELGPRIGEIRALIYEALMNKLKETDEIPSAESVKESVLSAISRVTQLSRIRDVYITRFLAI